MRSSAGKTPEKRRVDKSNRISHVIKLKRIILASNHRRFGILNILFAVVTNVMIPLSGVGTNCNENPDYET
jgi:hypothetical protein